MEILSRLARKGLRLHGFGMKTGALPQGVTEVLSQRRLPCVEPTRPLRPSTAKLYTPAMFQLPTVRPALAAKHRARNASLRTRTCSKPTDLGRFDHIRVEDAL